MVDSMILEKKGFQIFSTNFFSWNLVFFNEKMQFRLVIVSPFMEEQSKFRTISHENEMFAREGYSGSCAILPPSDGLSAPPLHDRCKSSQQTQFFLKLKFPYGQLKPPPPPLPPRSWTT